MATSTTDREIAHLRMHALLLEGEQPANPGDVVEQLLAVQGQDWASSQWAIGSRTQSATAANVLAAYDRGEIVRSWPMRGTLHAVPSRDIHWMLDLMGVRALSGVQRRWEWLGIDERMLEGAREIAHRCLAGGVALSRSELIDKISESGIDLTGQRAYHTIWYLSQTGSIVFGPTRDGEHLVVLLDEWVPKPRRYDRDEALAVLGRRYMHAHGPASVEDLVHWTKLPKRDCRAAIDAHREELVELDHEGTTLLVPRATIERAGSPEPRAEATFQALASFDEHLLGFKDRSAVLDPDLATRVDPGRNGVFRPTIVRDGEVIGTWKRTKRTRSIVVDVTTFVKIAKRHHPDIEAALARYGAFVGTDIDLRSIEHVT
jgi:hypothetical protein